MYQICSILCDDWETELPTDPLPFKKQFGIAINVKKPIENSTFFQWCATNRAIFSEYIPKYSPISILSHKWKLSNFNCQKVEYLTKKYPINRKFVLLTQRKRKVTKSKMYPTTGHTNVTPCDSPDAKGCQKFRLSRSSFHSVNRMNTHSSKIDIFFTIVFHPSISDYTRKRPAPS